MEEKIKYLEFIQMIISRLNQNSFQIKGWMITIVSGLLALAANSNNRFYILIAILPVSAFWGLDAFYLQEERKFRGLYSDVAKMDYTDIKISNFDLSIVEYKGGNYSYLASLFSKSIMWIYLIINVVLIIIFVMLCCAK